MLGEPGQGVPEDKRHRHEPRTGSDVASDRQQKFLISEDLWTSEFVAGLTCSTCVREEPGDRLCNVLDVDRLQFCLTCTARGFLDTRYCYAAALIGARAANHSRLV